MNSYLSALQSMVTTGKEVFIAPGSVVIGRVHLSDYTSVWYNAVIRADHDSIHIGAYTNIQDGCILHVDEGVPLTVGVRNVIGHGAILHGCTIGDGNLIGMRATIMNHAVIGNGCIIGAHALVTEGMHIPDYSLVLGSPARIVKTLSPEKVAAIQTGVQSYTEEAARYLQQPAPGN